MIGLDDWKWMWVKAKDKCKYLRKERSTSVRCCIKIKLHILLFNINK